MSTWTFRVIGRVGGMVVFESRVDSVAEALEELKELSEEFPSAKAEVRTRNGRPANI